MRQPNPENIAAAKADCRARFGHERIARIPLGPPFGVTLLLAAWDFTAASAHADARLVSLPNAASALLAERGLFPAPDDVEQLRARGGLLDAEVEAEMRRLHGFVAGDATAVPLTAATVPPGYCAPKEAASRVAGLQAANAGADLWAVTNAANGLALILRAPMADVVSAVGQASVEAQRRKAGAITWGLGHARDLCVWAPGALGGSDAQQAFDRHFEEKPGRADDVGSALLVMGGAGAARRGDFL